MNRKDLRFQKTEDNIRSAFLYCIDTMGFEKTKITDICNKARISRNTFYVHYEDKNMLMKCIYSDLEKEIFQSFEENIKRDLYNLKIESAVSWCVEKISNHHELLRILLKCSKVELRKSFERVYIDGPLYNMTLDYKKKSESIEARLNKAYLLDALIGYVETWLNNYDKISKKKVVDLMIDICYTPMKKYFEKVL